MIKLRKFFNEHGEYAIERFCKRTDSCLVYERRGELNTQGDEQCFKEFTIPLLVLSRLRRVCPFLYVYYTNCILSTSGGDKGLIISLNDFYTQVIEISGGLYTKLDCLLEFRLNFPRQSDKRDPSTSLFMEFKLVPRSLTRGIFSEPHKDSARGVTLHILSELYQVLDSWVVLDIAG